MRLVRASRVNDHRCVVAVMQDFWMFTYSSPSEVHSSSYLLWTPSLDAYT